MTTHCSSKKPFAEISVGNTNYSVKIKHKATSEGWGDQKEAWTVSTKVKKHSEVAAAKKEESDADRSIAAIRPNTSVAPSGPETAKEVPVKVSGFMDAQLQFSSNSAFRRGFLINDGAIYMTTDFAGLDFKIDIPFRMYTQGSPDLDIAKTRAQAFVGQKFANGFRWKAGQFDTTFGFEGNDTTDIQFTRQGNVYNFTDPFVHTGLAAGYDFNPELGINLYVTNPNDRGVLSGQNLQFGAQLVQSSPTFRFAPGSLTNQDAASGKMNVYLDLTAGVTMGGLAIDAECSYNLRNDIINPETHLAMSGVGLLLHALYTFNESNSFGVRGEWVTNQAYADPKGILTGENAQPTLKSQVLVFIGPQHYVTKNIRLKLDYALQSDQSYGSTSSTLSHGLQAASVFRF